MTLVILQPAGNQKGREHFVETVQNLVDIKSCLPYVAPQVMRELEMAHPTGKAGMWGVVAGKGQVNVNKWKRISIGDLVLFAADKKIQASAVVATKFTSERLASLLWNKNEGGETWKYMYSLDEIRDLDISYEEFNSIVGYKTNNVIQGFTVLDAEKSSQFLDFYGLRSERHIEEIEDDVFEEAITNLDGPLDRQVSGWHRKEQARARKRLLKNRLQGTCQLCGRAMSSDFLIAAHIKRRSECNENEKRDLDGVMMLACRFGCDYLFEIGMIGVRDNRIVVSPKLTDASALHFVIPFKDREVEVGAGQIKYFEWHITNRFQRK